VIPYKTGPTPTAAAVQLHEQHSPSRSGSHIPKWRN
jgi:hypothetical protein